MQSHVIDEIRWSWNAYEHYAWGYDELLPISRKPGQSKVCGGVGVMILDSIDTLYMAKLEKEYDNAKKWISFNFSKYEHRTNSVVVFEVTIRALGGLLSAYALTSDELYKVKAIELGLKLLPAFNKHTGLPSNRINLQTGKTFDSRSLCVAEVGTLHLEFTYLSHISGDERFLRSACKAEKWLLRIAHRAKPRYILSSDVTTNGYLYGRKSVGAGVDSYYEYLLKYWLQTGRKSQWMLNFYRNTSDAIHKHLIKQIGNTTISVSYKYNTYEMGHLDCFLPGMLALGSYYDYEWKHSGRDMNTAKMLLETCWKLYSHSKSVGAESLILRKHKVRIKNPINLLRPEVAESLYILWKVTGNKIYKKRAWIMFKKYRLHSRVTTGGYSTISDVNNPTFSDKMETFWVAETLKYLYLTLSDYNLDMNTWVLNTEAHPLPVINNMRRCSNPFYKKKSL